MSFRFFSPLAIFCYISIHTSILQAQWHPSFNGTKDQAILSVHSPDGIIVSAAGFQITYYSGSLPLPIPELQYFVLLSTDGGFTWEEISTSINNDFEYGAVFDVQFFNATQGYLASKDYLLTTNNGGQTWQRSDFPFEVSTIHFWDSLHGFAFGNDGQIAQLSESGSWQTITSPVTATIRNSFWTDQENGWISAYNQETTDDEDEEITTISNSGIYKTTDGGHTWQLTKNFHDTAIHNVFFFADNQTGYAIGKQVQGPDFTPSLWKTTDGGITFNAITLPLQVGIRSMLGTTPIETSYFVGMYWSDELHGHLVGTAYVSESSSSSGGDETIYRTVQYITADGGTTWEKTNLGTIEIDIMGTTTPENDGALQDAYFTCFQKAWAGSISKAWVYDNDCQYDWHCCPGFRCTIYGECIDPNVCDPACGEGYICEAGYCREQNSSDETNTTDTSDHNDSNETSSGGCQQTSQPAPILIFLLLVLGRIKKLRMYSERLVK